MPHFQTGKYFVQEKHLGSEGTCHYQTGILRYSVVSFVNHGVLRTGFVPKWGIIKVD
jgi:hypothetical protein